MPKSHDDIHADLYKRVNTLESKIDETNGYLRGVVESNEKLITLLEKRDTTLNRVIWALLVILLFSLGVIAFGAIGKEGMHSVRQSLPTLPATAEAIPPHNDFDNSNRQTAKPSNRQTKKGKPT